MEPVTDIFGSVIEEGMDVVFNPPKYKGLAHGLVVRAAGKTAYILHSNTWKPITKLPRLTEQFHTRKKLWHARNSESGEAMCIWSITRRAADVVVNVRVAPNRELVAQFKRLLNIFQD